MLCVHKKNFLTLLESWSEVRGLLGRTSFRNSHFYNSQVSAFSGKGGGVRSIFKNNHSRSIFLKPRFYAPALYIYPQFVLFWVSHDSKLQY